MDGQKRCDDCGEELGSLWFVFQESEGVFFLDEKVADGVHRGRCKNLVGKGKVENEAHEME